MKKQRQNRKPEAASNIAAPTQSKQGRAAKLRKLKAIEALEQINLHAAGIDVGSAQNFVCVPAHEPCPGSEQLILSASNSFGA